MKKRFLAVFLIAMMAIPANAVLAADAGFPGSGGGAIVRSGTDTVPVDPGHIGGLPDDVAEGSVYPMFGDVPSSHWAYGYVGRACRGNWVDPVGPDAFDPDGAVTYAAFCDAVCHAVYMEPDTEFAHESTLPGWYMCVSMAAEHGVLSGTPMADADAWDAFAGEPVTRGMMAVMLDNVLRDTRVVDPATGRGAAGGEFDDMPAGVVNALLDCMDTGIIDGYPDGRFGHADLMTRCQLAKVVCILHDVVTVPSCG